MRQAGWVPKAPMDYSLYKNYRTINAKVLIRRFDEYVGLWIGPLNFDEAEYVKLGMGQLGTKPFRLTPKIGPVLFRPGSSNRISTVDGATSVYLDENSIDAVIHCMSRYNRDRSFPVDHIDIECASGGDIAFLFQEYGRS
jgi:hypothetical protein